GYIGEAFARELRLRKKEFLPVTRHDVDCTRFVVLLDFLKKTKPEFLINAAGYTGKPNVDACENKKAETIIGNVLLPQTIAHACAELEIPWGQVSSGCIYDGAKIVENESARIEKDLTKPQLQALVEKSPEQIHGFTETDEPNFTFRNGPCSFYSGSKALGEEAISGVGENYIWRLRIPFDEFDNARNYLSKVQRYAKVYSNVNSISHRADFVRAALDLWDKRAPFGIYNVTNPGFVTTERVIAMIEKILKPARKFTFWSNDEEFYRVAVKTPRSNCVMDVSKLLAAGVKIRGVEEALEDSLQNWTIETKS
ncbi:MAG TPA: sugar nucleotide-binding protein, partial [Candidatus Baltobacteraceae bacterium]|nr:sugar nucleotide-binding protein [Candidatus Baltobacteraceae bacterium]